MVKQEIKKIRQSNLVTRLYWAIYVFALIFIYGRWFLPGDLTWGDWFSWPEQALLEWRHFNLWWNQEELGRSFLDLGSAVWAPFFWLEGQLVHFFSLTFPITSKIVWFGPFLILSIFSMPFFWRTVFEEKDPHGWFIASMVYSLNPYVLLLGMGGHISIAVVYAAAPLLIALVIKALKEKKLIWTVLSILAWVIASYYEVRVLEFVVFLTIIAVLSFLPKKEWWHIIKLVFWHGLSLVLAHLWWLILYRGQSIGTTIPADHQIVDQSYNNLIHSLMLYHAQWPDNILGLMNDVPLIYLIYPVLLILTLGLSFKKNWNKKTILVFFIIYLVSAFLTKGINRPIGEVYAWLFYNVPLIKPFRDASKFFLITFFSASLVLGLGYQFWQQKNNLKQIILTDLLIIIIFTSLLAPLFTTGMSGTLVPRPKPENYQKFDQMQEEDPNFSRVAWVPRYSQFSYYSQIHPRFNLQDQSFSKWFNLSSQDRNLTNFLQLPIANFLLDSASTQYVVMPDDVFNSIYQYFLPKETYRNLLNNLPWLEKVQDEQMVIYKNKDWYPQISTTGQLTALSHSSLFNHHLLAKNFESYPGYVFFNQTETQNNSPIVTEALLGISDLTMQKNNSYQGKLKINQDGNYLFQKNISELVKLNGKLINSGTIRHLTKGDYKVTVQASNNPFGPVKDLMTEAKVIAQCDNKLNLQQYNQASLNPEKNQMQINSTGYQSCLAVKIDQLEKNKEYQLFIDSLLERRDNGVVEIYYNDGFVDGFLVKKQISPADKNMVIKFQTGQQTKSALIFLKTVSKTTNWRINELKLFTPDSALISKANIFYFKTNQSFKSTQSIDSKIIFNDQNQYQIDLANVDHRFYLNLSTAYHPDWQATIIKEGRKIDVPDHFMMNGWSNGWLIKETGNYKINLIFKPFEKFQKVKYISLSWLGIMFILLVIGIIDLKAKSKLN